MLASRDEDLLAGDRIAATRHRFGLGPDQAKVGAAMGFGQVHRPGPFAGNHLRGVGLLLLFAAFGQDRRNRALGQAGVHFKCLIGRDHEFHHRIANHARQALPAKLLRRRQGRPAAVGQFLIGFLEALRRGHRSVFVTGAAFLIARLVERVQHFGGKLACLGQDRVNHFRRRILKAGEIRIFLEVENLVEDETHFTNGGNITGHDVLLSSQRGCRLVPASILY